jgi:tripartite-type tricarboxylate transporter receptor subunit TctC
MSGADLLQVAYKGETFALTDLMGGQVDVAFGFAIGALPHIRSGRLRPLAYTAAQRSSALPQVPTVAEAGVPGYEELVWVGFGVPAATPAPIVNRLHHAFYAAATTPAYRRLVEARGGEPVASSADEAVALLKSDFDRYRGVVKELGLRYDR